VGGPNGAALYSYGNGRIYFEVQDAQGLVGRSQSFYAQPYADGSSHTLVGCANNGVLTLYSEGVSVGAPLGTGTGLLSWWAPIVHIAESTGGSYKLNGFLGSVDFCSQGTPAACGW
jgi:hypothetical protein